MAAGGPKKAESRSVHEAMQCACEGHRYLVMLVGTRFDQRHQCREPAHGADPGKLRAADGGGWSPRPRVYAVRGRRHASGQDTDAKAIAAPRNRLDVARRHRRVL